MRYVYPFILESGARPKRSRCKRFVTFTPLVLMVWFAYWIGMVSQTCCAPLLSDAHSIPCADGHDGHHDSASAAHEPATPLDHGNCPQLKNAELVPASMASLTYRRAPKPLLVALLSSSASSQFTISNTPSSDLLYQQPQPPPSPYLRTRRLLI